jgi:NADPH-dependent 2,4-dienoyl-CoA reductase/sulfur reductase-like enzyme
MRRIVIAGASIAGMSAARELRRLGFQGSIQLIDEDRHAPYRRPAVSKTLLTGAHTVADVTAPWAPELGLERMDGVRLVGLDVDARVVHGVKHEVEMPVPFDGLVIATGSRARSWPEDLALEGVVTLRSASDAEALSALLGSARHIAIVGAGFIGLEAASSALARGVDVTIVESAELPLAHVLGPALGQRIADMHRARGVEVICGAAITEVEGRERVERLVLDDGRQVAADVVLVAIGAAPSVAWLEGSGLEIVDGVACDNACRVLGSEGVVAAGDVASWHNPLYDRRMRVEHWTNAILQGTFAAKALLGAAPPGGFTTAPYFWTDQFDFKVQSYGTSRGHDESVVVEDNDGTMTVAFGLDGTLIGVAGLNPSPASMAGFRRQIEARAPLAGISASAVSR